jgi:hypothetical protein
MEVAMRLAGCILASAIITALSTVCCIDPVAAQRAKSAPRSEFAKQNETCFQCHRALNPGLAEEWRVSGHGKAAVGCYDCHRAEKTESDAFEHNGATIAVIVSPKDCGRCHEKEVNQQ